MSETQRTLIRLVLICALLTLAVPAAVSRSADQGKAPAFDLNSLDRSMDPCVDFYQFSCGSWMKNNPIPPDRGSYGRGRELQEYNLTVLKGILEKASAADPGRSPVMQRTCDPDVPWRGRKAAGR